MIKRGVGDLGEDTLVLWASRLGVVANRVQRDRWGWDNLLEFPADPDSVKGGALDTTAEPVKCFVQVKSSDSRTSFLRVSLANLQRLACSPLPAFFLILEFDKRDEPQRASLIHVGASLAYRALERLREISVAPSKKLPHKVIETILIADEDRLPEPNATSLAGSIKSHVGADLHLYVERKREWVRSAGYDKGGQQLNVEVRLPLDGRTVQEVLMDFTLGIEPQLEVLGGDVRDLRFGIPSPTPVGVVHKGEKLYVVRKPICEGELIITSKEGGRTILTGDVYGPVGIVELLNRDNIKVRFQSPFIDVALILGKSGKIQFTFRLPGSDDAFPIGDLGRFSDAVLMAAQATSPDDVTFEIRFLDTAWGSGPLHGQVSLDTDAISRAQIGSHAWAVARRFDLSPATRVRVGALFDQQRELKLAYGMLVQNPEATAIEIAFTDTPPLEREVCAPIAFPVQIGESVCIVAGAVIGLPTHIDGSTRYTLSRRRWRHYPCAVIKAGDRAPRSRAEILEDIALSLSDGAQVCRWWDHKDPASSDSGPPKA